MVDALLGQSGIPAAIRDRITAAAEGNPLFLEQFVATLIEDGVIRRTEGGWPYGGARRRPSIYRCSTRSAPVISQGTHGEDGTQ